MRISCALTLKCDICTPGALPGTRTIPSGSPERTVIWPPCERMVTTGGTAGLLREIGLGRKHDAERGRRGGQRQREKIDAFHDGRRAAGAPIHPHGTAQRHPPHEAVVNRT